MDRRKEKRSKYTSQLIQYYGLESCEFFFLINVKGNSG